MDIINLNVNGNFDAITWPGVIFLFQTSVLADSINNRYVREFGTTIFSFTGAKIDIRDRIRNEIDEKKNFR